MYPSPCGGPLLPSPRSGSPVPEMPYPLYTAAMRGLTVSFTGIEVAQKKELKVGQLMWFTVCTGVKKSSLRFMCWLDEGCIFYIFSCFLQVPLGFPHFLMIWFCKSQFFYLFDNADMFLGEVIFNFQFNFFEQFACFTGTRINGKLQAFMNSQWI